MTLLAASLRLGVRHLDTCEPDIESGQSPCGMCIE